MNPIRYYNLKLEFYDLRFQHALANLMSQMGEVAYRLNRYAEAVVEDIFVTEQGIARSDIRKIVFDGDNWHAHLYNHRRIPLRDLREL